MKGDKSNDFLDAISFLRSQIEWDLECKEYMRTMSKRISEQMDIQILNEIKKGEK